MKAILTTILIATLACVSFGQEHEIDQEYERGFVKDLKGLTKYFIDAGYDSKSRQLIYNQITRARLSGLSITKSAEDAEVLLVLSDKTLLRNLSSTSIINNTFGNNKLVEVECLVLIEGKDGKKSRLVFSYNIKKILNKDDEKPATEFGKEFVKEYKWANGLK